MGALFLGPTHLHVAQARQGHGGSCYIENVERADNMKDEAGNMRPDFR